MKLVIIIIIIIISSNGFLFVRIKQIRNLSKIKQIVDIFKGFFIGQILLSNKEDGRLVG